MKTNIKKNDAFVERAQINEKAPRGPVETAQGDQTPKSDSDRDESGIFDPAKLRLSQNFTEEVGVKKLLITIPVRKPGKQVFFRAHPDLDYQLMTAILEDQREHEIYLVAPELRAELASELTLVMLVTCMDLDGNVFLFPAKEPDQTGRDNPWWQSAREAIARAQTNYIRMQAKMSLGAYIVMEATDTFGSPEWPQNSFEEILTIAFRDHYINSIEHPIVKQLRGRR
jgi:hypothetical protein